MNKQNKADGADRDNSTTGQAENAAAQITNPAPEDTESARVNKYLNDVCRDAGITREEFQLLDEIQRVVTREHDRTGIDNWLYTTDNLADCVNAGRSENHLFKAAGDILLVTGERVRSLMNTVFGSAEKNLQLELNHIKIDQVIIEEPAIEFGRGVQVPRYRFHSTGYEMKRDRDYFLETLRRAEDCSLNQSVPQKRLTELCNSAACLRERLRWNYGDRIHVELSTEARRHAALHQDYHLRSSRLIRYYATLDNEAVIAISGEDKELLYDFGQVAMNVWVRQRGNCPYLHFTPAQMAHLINDYRLDRFKEGITNSVVLATTWDLAELLELVFQPGREDEGYARLRCVAGAFLSRGYVEEADIRGDTVRIPIYGPVTRDDDETEDDFQGFLQVVEMREVNDPSELAGKRISFRGQEFRLQTVDGNPQTSSNATLPSGTQDSDVLQQDAEEPSRKVTMPSDSHGGGGAV